MPDERRDFADLVAATVQRVMAKLQTPTALPGTVTDVTGARDVIVMIDGSTSTVTAQNVTGRPVSTSNRVLVLFVPPHQAFVIGTIEEVVYRTFPVLALPGGGSDLSGTPGTSFRPGTASAAYFELYRSDFLSVGQYIDYDMIVYANAGTMTWRILCYEDGGSPQVVVGPTVETTNVQRSGAFTIPVAGLVGAVGNVIGKSITVRIEAKLDAGPAVTADIALISLRNRL